MADAAGSLRRRQQSKNSTDHESENGKSSPSIQYQYSDISYGYSWVFTVAVLFYAVISILCYIESHAVPSPKPHDTHYGEFSEARARLHLNAITSFGPRPTGSIANEVLAVNYLLNQIEKIKSSAKKSIVIEVDVQRPTGTFVLDFLDGFTSHYFNITNIVVRVSPVGNFPPEHTVLINAHFDSVPNSPGASDDAVSCATMLEILRVMAECPKATLKHGVIFLFNGAEENVLQASHGFITQHKWASSIRAFVNLEAAGAGGKEIVFQTGPEHPWLVRAYTDVAPYPCAQVIGQEIFQGGLIPSDTDFRIFRDYGQIPGIDIAYHSNGYVYHTFYDTPAAITNGSVQRAGENVFAVVMEMANSPLLQDPGEYRHGAMVFFDFVGLFMVHYPARIGVIVNSVIFVVASLFIINRFLVLSRKPESSSEVVAKSTLKCLVLSIGVLVLSWIAALVLSLMVAVLLAKTGHLLTWFCRPYLLIGLFVSPAVFGMGFVHTLAKNYNLKKSKSTDQKTILSMVCKQETDMFYSTLALWNALLGILTYNKIASAHLPLLMVIFPLVIRGVIWEKFVQKNSCLSKHVGKFMVCYLVCVVVPLCLTTYMLVTVVELFIPIMGRSGSDTIPDLFIAGILAVLVIMQTSYLISLTYIIRDVKWPALLLVGLTVSSIAISLSGLSFPYSKEYQCPKRFFYQHTIRTFHGTDGSVTKEDSGIWVNPLDYTGITHMSDVPMMQQAKPVLTSDGVYEGYPYYLPARNLFKKSFYIPGPPPDVKSLHWNFKLLSRAQNGNIVRFTFSIEGPDHMTIYFSTPKGVDFVDSSIGHLESTHDPSNRDGTTYFIYYSHGTRTEPWIFSLELKVDENVPKNARSIDFAVAAHYLNGKESRTPFLNELIQQSPDWVFAHSWVNIYESYKYTL